ncbi:MAG: hypothetical protein CMH41_02045 [Micrococcales bacterium]|nr:hypothetical protein [Micrococcales bacterium]
MHESRTPFIIGAVVFAVIFAIGAILLAQTGGGTAAPVTPSPTPTPSATEGTPTEAPKKEDVETDEGTTVVELRFTGDCEGCLVTARQTASPDGEQEWTATITDSVTQVELPTPNTYGLYFEVRGTTGGVENDSRQLLALAPKGTDPGSAVSSEELGKADEVKACWAGTTLDTAVVQLQVTATDGEVSAAWADPALPTVGKPVAANRTATASPNCS